MVSPVVSASLPGFLCQDDFVAQLREVGTRRYHDKHPFHLAMEAGSLSREQVRGWVLNRFYYQKMIPVKDAIIVSKLDTAAERRQWLQRIINHDGAAPGQGGIEAWVKLAQALAIEPDELYCNDNILPAVRFAVDAYVNFCRQSTVLEAVAASLTELFSPGIITSRMAALKRHYSFITDESLAYFSARQRQAPVDVEFALSYCLEQARTPGAQRACIASLAFKCEVLWSIMDAIEKEYACGS